MATNKKDLASRVNQTLTNQGKATFVNAPAFDLSPLIRMASELKADYSYVLREDGKTYRITLTRE
ncbi:MAG: hypothetical protein KME46_32655 [Brasilonema angustatum HA4187-MV1]|jgi:hypothetical protein|nr:hypothetical protein [Brasilonema angustatum HA4187-MV1]